MTGFASCTGAFKKGKNDRPCATTERPTQASPSSEPTLGSADEHEWRDQLSELANAVTGFLEEAEKDIAAHPAQSVIGALAAGILIGWLVGRR